MSEGRAIGIRTGGGGRARARIRQKSEAGAEAKARKGHLSRIREPRRGKKQWGSEHNDDSGNSGYDAVEQIYATSRACEVALATYRP